MSNIQPTSPSYFFGYYRPENDNPTFLDNYLGYVRDVSLVRYGADTVGNYISQASEEQVGAINRLGQSIGRGMNVLKNQMSDINSSLSFLNRNIDLQIEQQKLSNLLLQNMVELLRVPDSEKERQHSIELGIKFFTNARKDSDLYADALEELLKAETLMKQDYFVLHRIGCIYLYVENFINPEKALDYFLRAAKYASIESDPEAIRLVNALSNNLNPINDDINQIQALASDSYEKAAFAAYVIGQFDKAVKYQEKSLNLQYSSKNSFILSKYQVRNNNINEAINSLSQAIDEMPELAIAVFKEIDLLNEPEVLKLIEQKNILINKKIDDIIEKWSKVESTKAQTVISLLNELKEKSYEIKIKEAIKYTEEANATNDEVEKQEQKIDELITLINNSFYISFSPEKINEIILQLNDAKKLPLEKMQEVFNVNSNEIEGDRLKIGSKYEGGIVFYLDKTGKHGMVFPEISSFEKAEWGADGKFGTKAEIGTGKENTKKIKTKANFEIQSNTWLEHKRFLLTAAKIAFDFKHNGYEDWFLPSLDEMKFLADFISLNIYQETNLFSDYFWTSTEAEDETYAYKVLLKSGFSSIFDVKRHAYWGPDGDKGDYGKVSIIPIRSF